MLTTSIGDTTRFESATAYQKSLGLNLKEKSSARQKGAPHITKRGTGMARMFLYMAAFRLIQRDAVAQDWCAKKVERDSRQKKKAVIAVMRKLARAVWYVGPNKR